MWVGQAHWGCSAKGKKYIIGKPEGNIPVDEHVMKNIKIGLKGKISENVVWFYVA
jgi:hypothetical protein